MVDKEKINSLVQEWLDQAESELKSAKKLLESNFFSQAAYHSHQAVEFGLKALHIKRFGAVRGHNLVALARKVKAHSLIINECDYLNPAYEDARYVDKVDKAPSKIYDYDKTKKHIEYSVEVLEWVKKQLKK